MSIEIVGLTLPIISEGDDLIAIIKKEVDFEERDILVITETIISKARGRTKNLSEVKISEKAKELSNRSNKDQRICQLIIEEASEIIEVGDGFIITETDGLICANAGIDLSNARKGKAILPLKKPHEVAKKYSKQLNVRVIISDSVGRPFRRGAAGLAKGHSGIKPFSSYIGKKDLFGKEMESTIECVADELASAANLVLGESNQKTPIAVIRGFQHHGEPENGKINREPEESVFR